MNRFILKNIFILLLFTLSCQTKQSINKDLSTGAFSRGNGLICDDISIEIGGQTTNNNSFTFGEMVYFVFDNIEGFQKTDNKAYPDIAMHIVKNNSDTVYADKSLLKNIVDGTDLSPLRLTANFLAALPYGNDEEYKVYIDIFDKKGDGTFSYELPFKIKESELLDINTNSNYSNIYLWNETLKQTVLDNTIRNDHILILILEGIDDFKKVDNKVYPELSLNLVDNKGLVILSNPNMFSDYNSTGVNFNDFAEQVHASITFNEVKVNNPCKLYVELKDKKSGKEFIISTKLWVN